MDTSTFNTWRDAKDQVDALDEKLKAAKRRLAKAEESVLHEFERAGVSSIRMADRTYFLRRDVRASCPSEARSVLAERLRRHGLEDLVTETVNGNTLSAWVREQERQGDALPTDIAEIVNVAEIFSVRDRKRAS